MTMGLNLIPFFSFLARPSHVNARGNGAQQGQLVRCLNNRSLENLRAGLMEAKMCSTTLSHKTAYFLKQNRRWRPQSRSSCNNRELLRKKAKKAAKIEPRVTSI
jgi:hypothetical protein